METPNAGTAADLLPTIRDDNRREDRQLVPEASPSKPVFVWAAAGALFSGIAIIGWARWLGSDYFTPSPTGSDPFTGWRVVYLRAAEFGLGGISLVVAWIYLLRPLVRDRQLTFDGMFIIGCVITWFYDPLPNIDVWTFTYNAHFLNMGSWTQFIPFWRAPSLEYSPEPLIFIGSAYLAWFFFLPMLAGERFILAIRRRYPRMSTLGAFVYLWVVLAIVETVFFFAMTVPELIQFPGAITSMTIGAGYPWQYPVYDAVLAPFLFCGLASLRYFRDDKGRSFVEKGVDQIRCPHWVRKGLSLLAVTGALQCLLIFTYLVPYQLFAERVDVTPHMKSYMRGEACGIGTDYACPGKYVPIPGKDTLHIGPTDPRLPANVREAQGQAAVRQP